MVRRPLLRRARVVDHQLELLEIKASLQWRFFDWIFILFERDLALFLSHDEKFSKRGFGLNSDFWRFRTKK